MPSLPGSRGSSLSLSRLVSLFDFAAHRRLKFKEDLTSPSALGAILSLAGLFVVVALVFAETISYLAVRPSIDVALAPPSSSPLTLRFNLTFEDVSCELLSLTSTDALGAIRPHHAETEVHWYAIDNNGRAARRVKGLTPEARIATLAAEDASAAEAAKTLNSQGNNEPVAELEVLTQETFYEFIKPSNLALISYGAP